MPSVSKSKANSTSFKKGRTSPYKKPRAILKCLSCNIDFEVRVDQQHRRKCCSKVCTDNYKRKDYNRDTKALLVHSLTKDGLTNKEISEKTGIPMGSVASYLNKLKYRKYANGGQSYQAQKNKLKKRDDYKHCCVCGFDRAVELAHIVPASKGGELSYENTLPLCPNHHHLFDTGKLVEQELKFIEIEKENRRASLN